MVPVRRVLRGRRQAVLSVMAVAAVVLVGWTVVPAGAQVPGPDQAPTPSTTVLVPATTGLPGPAPAVTPGAGPAGEPEPPGLLPNPFEWIPEQVREAVNGWFRDLVADALEPTLELVGRTLLATPDITAEDGRARELWQGSAMLANTLYVLLVLVGGVILTTRETLQDSYGVKEAATGLTVGAVASNTSFWVADQGVDLTNALSATLLGQGADADHVRETLRQLTLEPLAGGNIFLVLLTGVLVVLLLVLVVTYVVRVALLTVLVACAPLALAGHALPQTEGAAHLWWRAFAGCLAVQIVQAFALATAVHVFFQADRAEVLGLPATHLTNLVVASCLLWVLVRVPVWVGRTVLNPRPSRVLSLVRTMVVLHVVRGVRGRLRGGAS